MSEKFLREKKNLEGASMFFVEAKQLSFLMTAPQLTDNCPNVNFSPISSTHNILAPGEHDSAWVYFHVSDRYTYRA